MAATSYEDIVVTGLNIFPIKACKGCKLDSITLDKYGVIGDRRMMLVDANSRFITQRRYPQLATISPQWINPETIMVTAPGMSQSLTHQIIKDGPLTETTVWNDTVLTVDQGDIASEWFSTALGLQYIRLVYSPVGERPEYTRPLSMYYPQSLREKLPLQEVDLADAAPVTIVSNESLVDLNARMAAHTGGHTVTLDRFRMNIELTGASRPYQEDEWLLITVGEAPILLYSENHRCKVPSVNQETGVPDKVGPLDILRQYRAPGGPDKALFGMFGLVLQAGRTVNLGDKINVLELRK
ncbi:PREDICTED: mitochondrial amidoxime-reducing component 1-like [Amphimedon queenslandica]|nr:PREDICTED: mitochondrial amidoxime-reducing component 1-like [Amphimedon queenslandica]|eukprot:XP_003388659.1 PREDICTED: mitochondrial amidoxime-reducing component 1-like [Amphimedon queenslandica]